MDETLQQKIASFFAAYPLKKYDKRQIIIQANDVPQGVLYLESGQVRVYDVSEQGSEVVVNVYKPPAFFPMSWAIGHIPNHYFYDAATDVSLRVAPVDAVVRFVTENPDVLLNLLARVYSGVEGMQRRMAHLMGGTSRTRVLFELSVECRRFGQFRPDGSCVVSIHEEELARRAGLSRETVNRELSKLKREKLIDVNLKKLTITNLSRLEEAMGDVV